MALELNGSTGVSLVQDGVVTAADLASTLDLTGKTVTLPAGVGGKVLQVVNYIFTSTWSTTSTSFVDVTNFNVSITPLVASSKVFVVCNVEPFHAGALQDEFRILRSIGGGSYVDPASISGGRFWFSSGYYGLGTCAGAATSFIDSPATTSAIVYKLQARQRHAQTMYIGKDWNGDEPAGLHSLTVMEIAA